ncbi:hypothetical protein A5656_06410 [Mycobacterium gordonae]|nr:hypothetical protein A5656_06410 [Mycobacterium gordonae]PJE22621.1 MAG: hypothetical protein CK431_15600 [Mycobacterium sp.]
MALAVGRGIASINWVARIILYTNFTFKFGLNFYDHWSLEFDKVHNSSRIGRKLTRIQPLRTVGQPR